MRVTMGWVGLLRGGAAATHHTRHFPVRHFQAPSRFTPRGVETSETEMATWSETMFRRPVED
jgi:hypothetical protein